MGLKGIGRRLTGLGLVVAMALGVFVLSGCAGPTSIAPGAQLQGYSVDVGIDPPTLNPPQLSTLSFSVTDRSTGKTVTQFQPLAGDVVLHDVLIRKDLLYFRHSYASFTVRDSASVQTYFPTSGTYYNFALFQPVGAALQVYSSTITTGDATEGPNIAEDTTLARVVGGVRVELVKSTPLVAGRPAQLLYHVSERGRAVSALWPYQGAAGHLWLIAADGGDFAHEVGAAEVRQLGAQGTPTAGGTAEATGTAAPSGTAEATGGAGGETETTSPEASGTASESGLGAAGTEVPRGSTAVPGPPMEGEVSTSPVPTLEQSVQNGLATLTNAPQPTLSPVQQTALSSILETPVVQPSVGYGPDVVFTHTFPRPGLYKLWAEFLYRGQVTTVDFVVRVQQ